MTTMQGDQQAWGDAFSTWDALVLPVTEPEKYLAEKAPSAQAGSYWPPTRDLEDDPKALRAWENEVRSAIGVLDGLLTRAGKARSDRGRAMRIAAIDRALADPRSGYLRRLRAERSAILRAQHHAGVPTKQLAAESRVSPSRIRQLMKNNKTYVSADRRLALETIRAEGEAKRAQDREAARAARVERMAEKRAVAAAARVAEGRRLAARIAAGASREDLQAELGYSRQKLAQLLAEAARADAAAADTEQVAA